MYILKKMGIAFIAIAMLACPIASGAKTLPTLKEGSKSTAVKTAQKQLIELGYLDKSVKVTGYYGEQTVAAVQKFQMMNWFTITGELDAEQQQYLKTDLPISLPSALELMTRRAEIQVPQGTNAAASPAGEAALGKNAQKIEAMIAFGRQFLGTRYKYGGRDPSTGFDCSGFVRYVLLEMGVKAPGSAQTQGDNDAWTKITNKDNLRRGDLVFFHTSGRSVAIGHSGIYLGNNEFIHSEPTGGGVIISTVFGTYSDGEPSYYNKNYLFARRVFE